MSKLHYYYPAAVQSGYVVYPESAGRYFDFPQHAEKRPAGQFPYYNVHLVCSGAGYVRSSGEWIELTAGTGFLYAPGVEQEYLTDPDRPWDVRWIHFGGEGERWFGDRGKAGLWAFGFHNINYVNDMTEELYRIGEHFAHDREKRLSSVLYELLLYLANEAHGLAESVPQYGQKNTIHRLADLIRTRCGEPWTLDRMAEEAGYSKYHFIRMFHQTLGRTPQQYWAESRILLAKKLLVSTDYSIKRIALEAGFQSASYFIAQFSKHAGVTPSEYRRRFG